MIHRSTQYLLTTVNRYRYIRNKKPRYLPTKYKHNIDVVNIDIIFCITELRIVTTVSTRTRTYATRVWNRDIVYRHTHTI